MNDADRRCPFQVGWEMAHGALLGGWSASSPASTRAGLPAGRIYARVVAELLDDQTPVFAHRVFLAGNAGTTKLDVLLFEPRGDQGR